MKKFHAMAFLAGLVAASSFAFGVYECLDSYNKGLMKCFSVFDDQKRTSCYWGETETLKASLEASTAAKICSVGFFRNERILVSTCESFAVPSSGTYILTVVNGNPLDKRGTAKSCSLSIWDGKSLTPLAEFKNSEPRLEKEIKLEAGRNYLVSADDITPVASYVTTIISEKKLAQQ